MDIIEVKVINGTSIFYDRLYHTFYYWCNGRKVKSVNINKSFGAKKKNKFKSFRYFDINFLKEWDEMKRELSK